MSEEQPNSNTLLAPLFDELRGERVVVRPYTEEDAAALHQAVEESREHIRPWLPFADEHKTVDESRAWIASQQERWPLRNSAVCGIFEAQSGHFLGGIGFHAHELKIPSFEIGYWLRASAEGRGYMAEAVRLLTRFAFEELGARRVEIQCDELNERSANVARRLGYTLEGRLRNEALSPQGVVRNTLVFSMIPEEWDSLRQPR